ncbi:MAG: sialidase family protein, partial [Limisphaerales bacterium]
MKEADPRWSIISPDTLAVRAVLTPISGEVPTPTGPRQVQLYGRRAIVSPNIQVHPSTITTQSEMSIATHPLNPDVVLAGANAVHTAVIVGSQGWYFTTDGGATWGGGDTLPTHTNFGQFMADPAVGIDLDGNLFFNALLYNGSSDCIAARSTDNGASWSLAAVPRDAGGFRDKNHLAIDVNPGSSFENYLYTAYTDFGPTPSPVMFSRSSDRGLNFSVPAPISGSIGADFAQGINMAVGPNGELYAAWSGYDAFPPVTTRLGFNKSTDGGATWQGAFSIRNVFDIRGQLNKGGNSIRVNSFPSMAVDRSGGPRHGWIYIVYAEKNLTTPDIFLVRSTDGGATWSSPRQVNQDGSGKDQWFSWISVDPATGHLYVVYY